MFTGVVSRTLRGLVPIWPGAPEVIWLTPESRYSWVLAGSDIPLYESLCTRVEVVPDLESLDRMARGLAHASTR